MKFCYALSEHLVNGSSLMGGNIEANSEQEAREKVLAAWNQSWRRSGNLDILIWKPEDEPNIGLPWVM